MSEQLVIMVIMQVLVTGKLGGLKHAAFSL